MKLINKLLIPFRMEFLWMLTDGGSKNAPLHKICHIYPTDIKLGTVLPYLRKIQKLYMN